jgi:hypothetical protein
MGVGRGWREPVARLVFRVSLGPPGDSGNLRQSSHGRRHRDDNRASIRAPTKRRPRRRDTFRLFLGR